MNSSRKNIAILASVLVVLGAAFFILKDSSFFSSKESIEEYVVPQTGINDPSHPDFDKIEKGIHLRTGFAEGEGLQLIINNCTTCHSAKLVTQNRMSKERWQATIRWMQETQNLWNLGENEEAIVNYLAKYYAPIEKGRRQNLANIEWYTLEDE
ncbi:MAG: monoheme cytochrome C [Maribacter sp.]